MIERYAILIALILVSCSPRSDNKKFKKNQLKSAVSNPENTITLLGPLNRDRLDIIMSASSSSSTLNIMSSGGLPSDAIQVAREIKKRKLNVQVLFNCISACAEYILPAAKTVTFVDEPMIGFHWNSIMNFEQLRQSGGDMNNCDLDEESQLKKLQSEANLNPEFWKKVEEKLVLKKYRVVRKTNECDWKVREFENEMWFPNSIHLKNHWGLKFQGTVCSDNLELCKTKIDKRWGKGQRVVIGDVVYVSKGRNQ